VHPLKTFTAAASLAVTVLAANGSWAAEQTSDARNAESIRCMVVATQLVQMDDAEAQKIGQMSAMYFMGRLDAAMSDKEIEDRLFATGQVMLGTNLQKDLERCGAILQERGGVYEDMGKRISAREETAAKK
jgi:hypothetical protein